MADTDTMNRPGGGQASNRLAMGMRIRLSVMLFLQYAAWGSWWMLLNKYMSELNFTGSQIGRAYATIAVASIFSPIIVGQIADRWVPTQYLLALLHLISAGMLYLVTTFTDFTGFYFCILSWALLYIPTISLTNSLSFHQIPDTSRDFPWIRMFGTMGWIVAGITVNVVGLDESSSQPIMLGMGVGVVMGLYCLLLPHTPPNGKSDNPLAFLQAFRLLRDRNYAFFMAIAFLMAVILSGYYTFTATFFKSQPLNIDKAAALLTLAQFTEMLILPLLPVLLKYFGVKRTFILGIVAWILRYGFYSLGQPFWLIVIAIALHGACYNFIFMVGYIHTDNLAAKDIRASAQALFNLVTMGLGMLVGNEIFGRLADYYTVDTITDWPTVWAFPAIGGVTALIFFALFFRENKPAPEKQV